MEFIDPEALKTGNLSSSQLDDALIAELNASLDALKQCTAEREQKLKYVSDLETRNAELETECQGLLIWKQTAIALENEVKECEEEVAQWKHRHEARGARLSLAIREINELRARAEA